MLRRASIAASAGVWIGALAGLATALADFGAHWLFMESSGDRFTLLARLACLEPAAGALIGGVFGLAFGLASPLCAAWVRRLNVASVERAQAIERALLACVCALPLGVPLAWVAKLLWSGGKMSRLPVRTVGVLITFALLLAGAWCVCWLVLRLFAW